MSVSGIQGQLLEVTVVGCNKLKDTEWFSRQDPYVCLEYGSTRFRTRTCTDGGKTPTFQEKFTFNLIEGLREVNVVVWNSNTISTDDFIGSGKIQLQKVLSQGYDDNSWTLQTKTGRYAGEVRLILHYSNANKLATTYAPSAPPYRMPPQPTLYSTPPPTSAPYHHHHHSTAQPPPSSYQPPVSYPPPPPSAYPPPPYPPPSVHISSAYAPPPHPSVYTSSAYAPPPPPPPPPHASPYYPPPPGPFPGLYPPPPY